VTKAILPEEHDNTLKSEHFRAWLEEQTRRSMEQAAVRAALADAQRRLDDLERDVRALIAGQVEQ
jgi:hypothetical protein